MLNKTNILIQSITLLLFLYINFNIVSSHTQRCEDSLKCDDRRDYKYLLFTN